MDGHAWWGTPGRGRLVARRHRKVPQPLHRDCAPWHAPQQDVCPCRRRVGDGKNHSPSVRCTDRAMPAHHELIARATTIRSPGASCSVRASTVNQHVCFVQTAFLPTAARNANASATGCAFAGKCSALNAKAAGERAAPVRRGEPRQRREDRRQAGPSRRPARNGSRRRQSSQPTPGRPTPCARAGS
jgi:hypothetical protein